MHLSDVLKDYLDEIPCFIQREPTENETDRWVSHQIGNRQYHIALPVTFTPYASVKSCSARCHFCSENLREIHHHQHSSMLRPSKSYFSQLTSALEQLRDVPLSYSLSGLEMTDDLLWFSELIRVLERHKQVSRVDQTVLYSNGAGLVDLQKNVDLMTTIKQFDISWVELSRHHFNDLENQKIMRFRSDQRIMKNEHLSNAIELVGQLSLVKLVCIVQSEGVNDLESLVDYIYWAVSLNVKNIIFRELSLLDNNYKENSTFNYIARTRVLIGDLAEKFINRFFCGGSLKIVQATNGYYFCNLVVDFNGIIITFESSSYIDLKKKHESGKVYKLIFHANGNLCSDWNPDRNILFSAAQG